MLNGGIGLKPGIKCNKKINLFLKLKKRVYNDVTLAFVLITFLVNTLNIKFCITSTTDYCVIISH